MRKKRRAIAPSGLSSFIANAVFSGLVAYCVISLIAGKAGLLAERDLGRRMVDMEQRLALLESDNLSLRSAIESLRSNTDRMAREARTLGYIRPGEKIVTMPNLPSSVDSLKELRNAEEVLPAGQSSGLPDAIIKTLALISGVAVFVASALMAAPPRRNRAWSSTPPESKLA